MLLQCAALANSAGIGGGPFYMPLFNVVLGFDLSSATALSHTVVSISAVGSSLYGLSQPSPHDSRFPLVDLDIAIVFIPALLFGVSWGASSCLYKVHWLIIIHRYDLYADYLWHALYAALMSYLHGMWKVNNMVWLILGRPPESKAVTQE